jgi:hypothetical protein
MLDKIHLYHRASGTNITTFRITKDDFGKLFLSIYKSKIGWIGSYPLSKVDPLGKFKKEIEGWWFCEDYVAIEGGIDRIHVDINNQFAPISPPCNKDNYAWFLDVFFNVNTITQRFYCINHYKYNHNLKKEKDIYHAESFVSLLEKIVGKIQYHKHHNYPDTILFFRNNYCYSDVGEDKYIKLLELFNK